MRKGEIERGSAVELGNEGREGLVKVEYVCVYAEYFESVDAALFDYRGDFRINKKE